MNKFRIYIVILIIIGILFLYFKSSKETFTNDEAVKNVASLYNSNMATVTNLRSTNNVTADTAVTTPQVNSGGRLHIAGPELLYLLNKSGVIVSGAWGGNGNLTVDGDTVLGKNVNVGGGIVAGNYVYSKGNGTGGTHFPWTDGNNYITSNNNVLRGGPTTIQGDFSTEGTTNLKGNVNLNNKIRFRTMNGVRVEDGWDIYQQGGVADINACANICMGKNTTLAAMYKRDSRDCWCKSTHSLYPNPDGNYDTVLFI